MTPLSDDELNFGRGSGGRNWFKKKEIPAGESVVIEIVDAGTTTQTNYPIKDQDFCYRLTLSDGRTWDESTASIYGPLLEIIYPDGKTFKPAKIRVSKRTTKPIRGSQYMIQAVSE